MTGGGQQPRQPSGTRAASLQLLVLERSRMATYALPPSGEFVIGSGASCDVRLEEGTVETQHAILHVEGAALFLLNLAASGTTSVGSASLAQHAKAAVSLGVILAVGGVSLVVQASGASSRLRQVCSHAYFEGRIEDECARVSEQGGGFVVARFVPREGTPAHVVEGALAESLREMDVLATYTPGEYEALLVDCGRAKARDVMEEMQQRVGAAGGDVALGWAHYPRDARTPEALFEAAAALLRVDVPGAPESVAAVEGGVMAALRPVIDRIAASSISVLILGETGAGKEVMAQELHALSPRASKPLVCINCAAVSESLLESELLGYERGAFTGATQSKAGLLETAHGGTVFLDEIGDMPLAMQGKFLRVIEQREITRLGALTKRSIDVRFFAATNRDLTDDVERGHFRRDLYYRLNGFELLVPPLRERVEEIEALAQAFAQRAACAMDRSVTPRLSRAVLTVLEAYAWPGNIRELRNVIERAVLLCSGPLIEVDHLPTEKMGRTVGSLIPAAGSLRPGPRPDSVTPPPRSSPLTARSRTAPTSVEARAEDRERIVSALEASGGNQTKAAEALGISRRTLIYRIEEYGLPRPKKPT